MQSPPKTQEPVRLVICDDHPLMRDAVKTLANGSGEFTVAGEAGSVTEALSLVSELKPALLVIDLSMPDRNGIEALYQIARQRLQTAVVVYSMHDDEDHVRRALSAGAKGFVNKADPPPNLLDALRQVQNGLLAFPQSILAEHAQLAESGEPLSSIISAPDPLALLSKREREIFYLLIEGLPNRTIAQRLFVSPRTIETHRARVIRKLGCCSTADLIRYAIRHHLSSP